MDMWEVRLASVNLCGTQKLFDWAEKRIPVGANGFLRLYGMYSVLQQSPVSIGMDFHRRRPWRHLNRSRSDDWSRAHQLTLKSSEWNLANHFWHTRSVKASSPYTRHIFLWRKNDEIARYLLPFSQLRNSHKKFTYCQTKIHKELMWDISFQMLIWSARHRREKKRANRNEPAPKQKPNEFICQPNIYNNI